MNHVSCVSIDLINADKPPAALAFLAGACELVKKEYECFSLNSYLLTALTTEEYNQLYAKLKIDSLIDCPDSVQITINSIVDKIKALKSDTVIVSVFSFMQMPITEMFLTTLRAKLPEITVFAGGPGVTYTSPNGVTNGNRLLTAHLVDYYCLGEGDEVLPEFLRGNRNMLGLNGREYATESWVPQIDDLTNKYLLPSYRKIDTVNYHNLEQKSSAVFSISTSRGCVRSCSFCDVSNTWKKFRFRSGVNVAEEILKHHLEVGAVHFTIVDSLINGSLKSFNEFNTEMIRLKQTYPGLARFSYNGMFIVRDRKSHPEEFFANMKAAGCDSLAIGVETGSDRLRFEMNKKFTNADLDHHLEMCQKYGIKNNFLTFVGYPTETRDDYQATLDMLSRYQKYLIDDTIIGINHSGIFNLLPDTPVFNQREELGIHWEYRNDRSAALDWSSTKNDSLTIKERAMRDLNFRQRAIELRYPIPYSDRYLEYMKQIEHDYFPVAD
jgi:radical SAM superfamily enzyme YgiQ (UPF0313 family)